MDAIKAKEVAIYCLAVEVQALSETMGFAMEPTGYEPLTAKEKVTRIKKAKEHFENMLAKLEKFDVADFDALIEAVGAEV